MEPLEDAPMVVRPETSCQHAVDSFTQKQRVASPPRACENPFSELFEPRDQIMATGSVAERVSQAMAESVLIRTVESVRQDGGLQIALGGASVRPLTDAEIEQLERQGNVCEDWSKVQVADGFDPARVCRARFHGHVVLGAFTGQSSVSGVQLPTGIVNSTLVDAVIGNEALIQDVRMLARCVVGSEAVLLNCGSVTCDGE
ncbi:MAG TPA: DUF4954 family protein, partial [Planctomycetaceae bacterium]|nr:DUF4954 family protein [Planctomycetaceae bacterium]